LLLNLLTFFHINGSYRQLRRSRRCYSRRWKHTAIQADVSVIF